MILLAYVCRAKEDRSRRQVVRMMGLFRFSMMSVVSQACLQVQLSRLCVCFCQSPYLLCWVLYVCVFAREQVPWQNTTCKKKVTEKRKCGRVVNASQKGKCMRVKQGRVIQCCGFRQVLWNWECLIATLVSAMRTLMGLLLNAFMLISICMCLQCADARWLASFPTCYYSFLFAFSHDTFLYQRKKHEFLFDHKVFK